MKRIFLAASLACAFISSQALAEKPIHHANPIQEIYVSNMIWNPNATGGAQGLTPTSVVVAFNNGGSKPCYTTTLPFKAATTILVGTGQTCVAAVTSVTITPVAGPAGMVFAKPADTTINGSYYSTMILLTDNTDPIFDTTNGNIATAGVINIAASGS